MNYWAKEGGHNDIEYQYRTKNIYHDELRKFLKILELRIQQISPS